MALYSSNRRELRHYVARLMGDLLTGTVASPASGTFVCTESQWNGKPDDYFNDWRECYVYSGSTSTVGNSYNPTDWVSTSNTMTFVPAATLVTSDSVELHQRFTVAEYNDAINMAIEAVAKEALVFKMDEETTLSANTWQYTIPSAFAYIHRLDLRSSTSSTQAYLGEYDDERGLDPHTWRIVPGSTGVIEFVYDYFTPSSGHNLRIIGMASPATLSSDSTQCPISPKYIAYEAAAILHDSRVRGDDDDSKYHERQAIRFRQIAEAERQRLTVSLPAGSRRVSE